VQYNVLNVADVSTKRMLHLPVALNTLQDETGSGLPVPAAGSMLLPHIGLSKQRVWRT
jgi:hypothetical protein